MTTMLSAPYSYFTYPSGTPLVGGKVYTYQAGTTTPKTTYTDSTLAVANANPVILDSSGIAQIWLNGTYKIVVKDYFDNTISTTDNVAGSDALSSSTGAGGFVNKFRNGNMDVWQRSTSGTITAGLPAYSADGWIIGCTGANVTWQRAVQNNNGCLYYLLITGASGVTNTYLKQRIEGQIAEQLLSGGNVTVQAWVFNSTGATITPTITIKHATAIDNWASTVTDVSAVSLQSITSGFNSQISYTFTPSGSTGNGLEITIDFGAVLDTGSKAVGAFGLDIRATPGASVGLNGSPPALELRPVGVELAYCQRYYYQLTAISLGLIGFGWASGANVAEVGFSFPATMRIRPTLQGPTTPSNIQANGINGTAVVDSADANTTTTGYSIQITVAAGIAAASGAVSRWKSAVGTDALAWTAEL